MQNFEVQKTVSPPSKANAAQSDSNAGLRLPAVPVLKTLPRQGVAQMASAFSKHVIAEILPEAFFELGMIGELELRLLFAAPTFLKEEIADPNDFSEAYNAFMHIYNGLVGEQDTRYILVAEALKKTVFERLRALEEAGSFPPLTVRGLVGRIFMATAKYGALIASLPKEVREKPVGAEEESFSSDESDGEEEGEEKEHHWTLGTATGKLESSTKTAPLSYGLIKDLEKWMEVNSRELGRDRTRELSKLIKKANDDADAYVQMTTSTRPKVKKKRVKKTEKLPQSPTFAHESGSEESEAEFNPDVRLKKYPVPMASVTGRSHVYGVDDKVDFRYLVTGLPYADTYLALFKDGTLVPRTINSARNRKGRRKKMSEVAEKIKPAVEKRDLLFKELDALNKGLDKLRGEELQRTIEARDAKTEELRELLALKIRPHVESLVFGSSIAPTDVDIEATATGGEERSEVKKALAGEKTPSVASELITTQPGGSLTTGINTETHAEQSLLNTELWRVLINKLVDAIKTNKDHPEEITRSSFTVLQLVLNRSTCIGCARELTAELISFWIKVARVTGLKSWREAQFTYGKQVRFMIDFPAIYEASAEAKLENANLIRILLGLKDAGWQVRVTTGIKASEESNKTNEAARSLAEGIGSTPSFFVGGWDPVTILQFPIPEALVPALEQRTVALINGVRYWLTDDKKSLTRTSGMIKDSISQGQANAFKFGKL